MSKITVDFGGGRVVSLQVNADLGFVPDIRRHVKTITDPATGREHKVLKHGSVWKPWTMAQRVQPFVDYLKRKQREDLP